MATIKRYRTWIGGAVLAAAFATIIVSCGGTGGGGGRKGNPDNQFILNANTLGRLLLTVNPLEVDANKSDRIGLSARLTDSRGTPIRGIQIAFFSDVEDITFIPEDIVQGNHVGFATTDSNGVADVIAIAGSSPTGTGDIIGTAAIFAEPPPGFGLLAQVQVTLFDVGFIDADVLGVIPDEISLGNPRAGETLFFTIVGGFPPYNLLNEAFPGFGAATMGQHCTLGCTENGGVLCVGSPCQTDADCNEGGSSTPADVCIGPINRCLASCRGSNCAGARCDTDADCNDGSPTPANVCKDSGQAILYTLELGCGNGVAEAGDGTHDFSVNDSRGASVQVTVNVSLAEQCDGTDLAGQTCESLGFTGGTLVCTASCTLDTSGCTGGSPGVTTPTPGPGGETPTPGAGETATPGPGDTPTPTGPAPTPTAAPGVPSNLTLALIAPGESGDNGNNTLTTVIGATVTDLNGNPVFDGTLVTFVINSSTCGGVGTTCGAVINSPSATNQDPPCDVSNFENDTAVTVLNQPGVAHTCITYPVASAGQTINITATTSGVAPSDNENVLLPPPPP